MKGDFSRQTFDRKKHYRGVLMQQGRVQTDADWNEQEAIQRRRDQIGARDLIGRSGAPESDPGFEIAIAGSRIRIGAGRHYVDGILAENETPDLSYDAQPDLPGGPDWMAALGKANRALVYLDVWERHVTALEDPQLHDPALGGPDTSTRVKAVWQVRVLPLGIGGFETWDELVADSLRQINARTAPAGGYRGSENHLYRVEVHAPGGIGEATFKWSRDNGSVVAPIQKIRGKDITLIESSDVDRFAPGEWVEVTDDRIELEGRPGQLVSIDAIAPFERRITLQDEPTPLAAGLTGVDERWHPKSRRWDQSGPGAGRSGVPTTASWLALEHGIEIRFEDGTFRSGDYWLIPARAATREIEWPPFSVPNRNPQPQPRRGIHHHHCRLALIERKGHSKPWRVAKDCRTIFPTLAHVRREAGALHVIGINWRNDDRLGFETLFDAGLRIRLDEAPAAASLTNETVQVAIDVPCGPDPATAYERRHLRGTVGLDPENDQVITWVARGDKMLGGIVETCAERRVSSLCVRVTLKGSAIWGGAALPSAEVRRLDGRTLGSPSHRADGVTPCIGLALPSGSGAAASDFESWFFVDLPAPRSRRTRKSRGSSRRG